MDMSTRRVLPLFGVVFPATHEVASHLNEATIEVDVAPLERTVVLEHEQALPPGGQPVPAQQSRHGAGRHPEPPQPLRVRRQPRRAPGRFGDRDREQPALDFGAS